MAEGWLVLGVWVGVYLPVEKRRGVAPPVAAIRGRYVAARTLGCKCGGWRGCTVGEESGRCSCCRFNKR